PGEGEGRRPAASSRSFSSRARRSEASLALRVLSSARRAPMEAPTVAPRSLAPSRSRRSTTCRADGQPRDRRSSRDVASSRPSSEQAFDVSKMSTKCLTSTASLRCCSSTTLSTSGVSSSTGTSGGLLAFSAAGMAIAEQDSCLEHDGTSVALPRSAPSKSNDADSPFAAVDVGNTAAAAAAAVGGLFSFSWSGIAIDTSAKSRKSRSVSSELRFTTGCANSEMSCANGEASNDVAPPSSSGGALGARLPTLPPVVLQSRRTSTLQKSPSRLGSVETGEEVEAAAAEEEAADLVAPPAPRHAELAWPFAAAEGPPPRTFSGRKWTGKLLASEMRVSSTCLEETTGDACGCMDTWGQGLRVLQCLTTWKTLVRQPRAASRLMDSQEGCCPCVPCAPRSEDTTCVLLHFLPRWWAPVASEAADELLPSRGLFSLVFSRIDSRD
ncbi:unnamed protein product, partial [Ixodes hexagonus]